MENSCSGLGLGARSWWSSQGLGMHGSRPRFFSTHTSFARPTEDRVREEHGSLACCMQVQGQGAELPSPRHKCVDGRGRCLETASAKSEGQGQEALARGHTNE